MRKQKRRDSRLSSTDSDKQPNHLLFFDTETVPNYISETDALQELRLGVARYIHIRSDFKISRDHSIVFRSGDELLDFILSKISVKKSLYIFAHNVGFDLMVTSLPFLFRQRGIEIRPYIRNQMMFIWSIKVKGGSLKFINTGNFTPYKLSKVAEDLGMEKLSVDFETDNEDELIEYCKMDVEIIKELVLTLITFLKDNNLGSFKMTIASTALNAYRRRFNTNLPYTHTNKQVLALEQEAYKGGRTECFKIGEFSGETYSYADINSMYPYCMTGDSLPKRMIRPFVPKSLEQLHNLMEHRYILADVTLNTTTNFLGIVYKKDRIQILNTMNKPSASKLIFPTGRFRQVLHHDELNYAIQNGFIEKIHLAVIYEKGDLFTEYVEFFTDMKVTAKESNNSTYYLMAKLFLNSLYGKFAQLYKYQEMIEQNPNHLYDVDIVFNSKTDKRYEEFIWFGERWGSFTDGYVSHSIPVIAGAITARARMLLWEYMENVGMENMYYSDTDSLIVNNAGFNKLSPFLHPTKLGHLDLEKETDKMIINGCKDYMFDGKRVLKGVPLNAIEIAPRTFQYDQFEGMGQWQRRDMTSPPLIYQMTKTKISEYDKGIVESDGTVTPFIIADLNA